MPEVLHRQARVVDAGRSRPRGEREELAPGTDRQQRQRALGAGDGHPEQPLVEVDGPLLIRHEHREMADVPRRDQPGGRRRLRRRAELAEQALAAAVGGVLQLHHDAVRVAEVELRRPLRRAAEFGPPHSHAHPPRRVPPGRVGRRDAVPAEGPDEAAGVEVVHREAEMVDVRPRVGSAAAQREELRPVPDAQNERPRLPRRDRHPEQALVERQRPLEVGDGQRHVVPGAHRNRRSALRLPGQAGSRQHGGRRGQRGEGSEERPAGRMRGAGRAPAVVRRGVDVVHGSGSWPIRERDSVAVAVYRRSGPLRHPGSRGESPLHSRTGAASRHPRCDAEFCYS